MPWKSRVPWHKILEASAVGRGLPLARGIVAHAESCRRHNSEIGVADWEDRDGSTCSTGGRAARLGVRRRDNVSRWLGSATYTATMTHRWRQCKRIDKYWKAARVGCAGREGCDADTLLARPFGMVWLPMATARGGRGGQRKLLTESGTKLGS
ncbi:hypothetical protein M6B38_390815 [Iris pallida]|uniref:Uncharacterized protein n=1 Tax=Iris pallida TaxID=29817 RepID=A0AAX6FZT3_IRIPA|nr:hypothetical protein M6B38_390815 [Iris pallida]